ncbi:hypothetical protein BASA50_010139 [Batrachochytrium salamandrivorans]|uniref:ubiquitinyl hydrolase 1 n=1 Tax=Batrachochytrium salamandrivorans TaxID=1357716 RepID=A0ABQ8F2D7_9FUNG|nr:hypothetical protein BASA60_001310 [Batrachochytrium salamandrivorans]KAH6589264.1 hypothetical protein BASA50_010139 [Batrachochytrium salamandrivorans]KAH6590798.1 hypothetical protein BASA61_005135 [Batrachochytrium salamandrivorans]KAH9258785.1 hypothetical protein BASA81_002849 [Batrachochytrium salamandrivorans]
MTMTANTGSSAATTNTAISSTPPPSHSALTVMPFGIHRSSMDSSTHGCRHLADIKTLNPKTTKTSANEGSSSTNTQQLSSNSQQSSLSPESATLSAAAATLFESYRSCVRYSLTYRNRFQLHIYKKGREFKYMTAVDDDEMAATNTGSTVPNIHSTASTAHPTGSTGSTGATTSGSANSMSNATSNPMSGSPQTALDSFPPLGASASSTSAASASCTKPTLSPSTESPINSARKRKRSSVPNSMDRIVAAADKLPTPACCTCDEFMSSSRIHACLQCVFLGCWKDSHIQKHLRSKNHMFAMDFAHCTVFCCKCNDYVYDLDMERILNSERSRINMIISRIKEPNNRRVLHQEWVPTLTEIQQIQDHSTLQKCSGLRGLRNMGSTCFMNTILQTFIHNPLLRAHFLSDKHDRQLCPRRDTPCLACEMDDLFRQFYTGKTSPYGPTSFLYAMWMSQKHLAGYQQQDAHEFFISVLNEIHNNCSGQQSHAHSITHPCKCIIHQVFGGLLQSDVTCQKCGNVTTACDPILDISLDIKSSSKAASAANSKKGGLGVSKPSTSTSGLGNTGRSSSGGTDLDYAEHRHKPGEPYSLLQCLEGFTLPERLGPNQYTCASCGNTFQEATKQLSMKHLPPVLAIQLKRFEHTTTASTKIDTLVKVPSELDMTPHTTRSIKLRTKLLAARKDSASRRIPLRGIPGFDTMTDGIPTYKYSLFAIVNHEGKMDTGHYKAYAKCRDQWFMFDDHTITVTTQKTALESNGYMCFYIRDNAEYAPTMVTEFHETLQIQRANDRHAFKQSHGYKIKRSSQPRQQRVSTGDEEDEEEERTSSKHA